MGNFGFIEIILILFSFGCVIVLPILALSDILQSRFEGNDAILMALIVIFVPIAGPILYLSFGPARKIKP